jgi:RNA polymerase subunit RPABC4/transcription elongation factor Spt4
VGLLDEAGLEAAVAAGCAGCGGHRLAFRSYVDGALTLIDGEPAGRPTWVYDGEKFIDGVYAIHCADCKAAIFEADVCPRCHAPGGLGRALAATNRWSIPRGCPSCDGEENRYVAHVPARVDYEGKRAEKARTSTELHEPGFHGLRAECKTCGTFAEQSGTCPLCDGPGPLRPRPG